MVKTQFTLKELCGIVITTFSALFGTYFFSGSFTITSAISAAVVTVFAIIWSVLGVPTAKVSDVVALLTRYITILSNPAKTLAEKHLEIELNIKKDLEIYNAAWVAVNESADPAATAAKATAAITSTATVVQKIANAVADAAPDGTKTDTAAKTIARVASAFTK